jgi:hypothetical protein
MLLLFVFAPPGCSGRKDFTPETFATVTPGMPEAKVIEVLGKPEEAMEAGEVRRLFWETKGNYYSISFKDGKVVEPMAHGSKEDYVLMKGLMQAAKGLGPGGKGDPSKPEQLGVLSANLAKIQPKASFKVPGKLSSDEGIQLSSDGKRFALAYSTPQYKSFTQIWDIAADLRMIAEFEGGKFALSPSGKFVLTSGDLFTPKVFNVDTKQPVCDLPTSFSFGFFRNDNIVVLTTRSYMFMDAAKGKITQWDITKNADAGSFEVPDNRFSIALPAKNGKEYWLFMSHNKFEVECFDLDTRQLARTVKPESDDPQNPLNNAGIYITVAPDSTVFGSDVRRMHFYDAETGKKVGELPSDLWATPSGFLPGGPRYFARPGGDKAKGSGLAKSDLVIYDWKNRQALAALTGQSAGEGEPFAGASADGKTAVTALKTGEGLVFDISSVK